MSSFVPSGTAFWARTAPDVTGLLDLLPEDVFLVAPNADTDGEAGDG